jgi:transcriptional regulator with PAS, ATPase and Fis domain
MASETQLIHDLVGESAALKIAIQFIQLAAGMPSHVLVQGENGTGKELAVQAIHRNSLRRNGPFIVLNAAALPRELMESEWFGHEKGAFTGAVERKFGVFDVAHRGTLFLDEMGDIPLEAQPKLLRVIEHGTFRRIGGTQDTYVDVRIIAATNKDLLAAVQRGEFREDLYHRLSIARVRMPALRTRLEDIPLLVRHFISNMGSEGKAAAGKPVVTGISPEAVAFLCNYHWPGNVRELRNVIARAIVLASGDTIEAGDLQMDFLEQEPVTKPTEQPAVGESLKEVLLRTERAYVEAAHKRVNGDPAELARLVKIHPAGLSRYLTRLGLSHLKGKSGRGPRLSA